jgi:hypothetical protein
MASTYYTFPHNRNWGSTWMKKKGLHSNKPRLTALRTRCSDKATPLYAQMLTETSLTNGSHLPGIVHLRTKSHGRIEVFTEVTMKNAIFWDVTPRGSLRRFLVTTFPVNRFLSLWWWRRYVPPKRRFLQEPYGVTSQKMTLFKRQGVCFLSVFGWQYFLEYVCDNNQLLYYINSATTCPFPNHLCVTRKVMLCLATCWLRRRGRWETMKCVKKAKKLLPPLPSMNVVIYYVTWSTADRDHFAGVAILENSLPVS